MRMASERASLVVSSAAAAEGSPLKGCVTALKISGLLRMGDKTTESSIPCTNGCDSQYNR
jgi:hypothetical protein